MQKSSFMKMEKNESFLTKYKPYFIKDFKLNPHTESILQTFLEMDDLNLLIYGHYSSGKTMLLEALIREYYQLKKTDLFPEHNILYINNLKEQGISYYRNEMKTFCQSQSIIYGKKKMIIIDDLDNVNEQSQQVFRNYIDRYKHNIHFLAVCSNMQKVIESIQSRVHIIQLHPLLKPDIKWHMENIMKQENMVMGEDCKDYLLSISNHSVRSVVNSLEKLYIYNQPITLSVCQQVCSNISFQHFDQYIDAYNNKDLQSGIAILYDLFYSGYSVMDILDFFFLFVKATPKIDEKTKYQMIPFLCKYITVFHTIHEDVIELALFTNSLFNPT